MIEDTLSLTPFLTHYVELLATIAKINGDAGRESEQQFETLLQDYHLSPAESCACLEQFRAHPDRTYEKTMLFMLHRYNEGQAFKGFLLYGCVFMAFAKGEPSRRQHEVLDDVIAIFNISEALQRDVLREVRQELKQEALDEPHQQTLNLDFDTNNLDYYELLNVERGCSYEQLKHAHRQLMKQYHPDRLESIGLPQDIKAMMTHKAIQIQLAYESIKKEEGF